VQKRYGIKISPDSIYDAHIKRIHEYKRQLLNALHIIMLYNRLKDNPNIEMNPRTFIFAGKSAPGYYMAKLIIKLIHCLADVINGDEGIKNKLKVVFMPNYSVSLAQEIIPAADVSEQISTAGMEASGTGCMKLSMNGALTIGTLDGANIEIKEEVGDENIFICGNTVEQLAALRSAGYDPNAIYQKDPEIKRALDLLFSDFFNPDQRGLFEPIRSALLYDGDHFMHLADLRDYADAQARLDRLYSDQEEWSKKAILNVARMGKFSSDRTIAEYNNEIWHAPTININMREKRCDTLLLARKNVNLE
jgi:starch phosphorylase